MKSASNLLIFYVTAFLSAIAMADTSNQSQIDKHSFYLGGIHTWVEVVDIGIKKMALSSAMSAEEMDKLEEQAREMAENAGVEIYRESGFLVTDLFPLAATRDKQVLIIYRGNTLNEYNALKERKAELVKTKKYSGAARREIAWAMGKLLSYPDEKIDQLIVKNHTK